MTLVVGLGVLEDEAVGALQPVGALLHAVRPVFEVVAFYALVRALGGRRGRRRRRRGWRSKGISEMEKRGGEGREIEDKMVGKEVKGGIT